MMLLLIVSAGIGAIVLSELLGRGAVVYTRMAGLCGSYLLFCAAAGGYLLWRGGDWIEVAAVFLSVVPIMAAWLGFRIHISNSITLEMAGYFDREKPKSFDELARDYGLDEHADRRIQVLKDGGYLTDDPKAELIDTPRSRLILLIMRILCGPKGPASVAAYLERRDGQPARDPGTTGA